jgi:hypothetical protein
MGGQTQAQPQQAYQPQQQPQQNPLSQLSQAYKGGQVQPGAMQQQPMARFRGWKDAPRPTLPQQPGIQVLPEPPRANPITLNSQPQQQAQIMPQQQQPQIMPLENSYGRPSKMDRRSMLNRQFNAGGM